MLYKVDKSMIDKKFYNKMEWFGHRKGEKVLSNYIDYNRLKNKKVLEVGYGYGTLAKSFIENKSIYTGIDLSSSHYKFCSDRFEDEDDADFICGNAEKLPFEDNSFDFVISWGVIHHTPKTQQCIDEIHRVLKNDGKCFLMLYHKNSIRYWFHKMFKFGIIKGGLFKHNTTQEFINSVTDNHDKKKEGCPLAKAYTKEEIRYMFKEFNGLRISLAGTMYEADAIPSGNIPITKYILPKKLREWVLRKAGWFLLIKANK